MEIKAKVLLFVFRCKLAERNKNQLITFLWISRAFKRIDKQERFFTLIKQKIMIILNERNFAQVCIKFIQISRTTKMLMYFSSDIYLFKTCFKKE